MSTRRAIFPAMSTLVEVEAAIEHLPTPEVEKLAAWLAAHRARRMEESAATGHDLDVLIGSWQEDAEFDTAIRALEQVDEAMWR